MCDYSLMEYPNRLAVEGEVLAVHRFRSGSLGLASIADCTPAQLKTAGKKTFWAAVKDMFLLPEVPCLTAVCIPPGARLILHDVPQRCQRTMGVGSDEEVTFVQISATVNYHRDAVRFRTGQTLRLQDLQEGQRVEILDLGFGEAEAPEDTATAAANPLAGVTNRGSR